MGDSYYSLTLGRMLLGIGMACNFMGGICFLVILLFFFLVSDQPLVQTMQTRQSPPRPGIKETFKVARTLFTRKDFWIISFSTFCRYGIYAAVQALWAGPYLIQVAGLSSVTTGNIILFMSIGLIIGCPASGHLSDRVSPIDFPVHSRYLGDRKKRRNNLNIWTVQSKLKRLRS